MKYLVLCLFLFGAIYQMYAQPKITAQPHNLQKAIVDFENTAALQIHASGIVPDLDWLQSNIKQLHNTQLHKEFTRFSKLGTHTFYLQYYNGKPIQGAYLKVDEFDDATVWIQQHLVQVLGAADDATCNAWIAEGNYLLPVMIQQDGDIEVITDALHNVIRNRDMRRFCHTEDTMVFGKVFLPDPLTSAGVIYGQDSLWLHFRDSNVAIVNNQRKQVSFTATLVGDSFELKNNYVQMLDFAAPFAGITRSATPNFDFLRASQQFKDVNAYYHINATQNYLTYLGYNLVQYPIKVDASSSTGDNSFFRFTPDTSLNFGLGGIPDAEDADVVVHEYTHAISFDINPFSSFAQERGSIEEAICDAMAAIRSKAYTTFNWRRIFNYDGPNPVSAGFVAFWAGRNGNSSKTYENRQFSLYADAEIWSSTLLDISEVLGVDTLMNLVLSAHSLLTPSSTMPQAAWAMIKADSILHNAKNIHALGNIFTQRKFGNDFPVGVIKRASHNSKHLPFILLNTYGFSQNQSDLVIKFDLPTHAHIQVFDLEGRQIHQQSGLFESTLLQTVDYNKGMYILFVEINGSRFLHRIIKF
jgi:hypothetical protein